MFKLVILLSLLAIVANATAAEAQTEVGASPLIANATHRESVGTAKVAAIPAAMIFATSRMGQFEITAEGLPPMPDVSPPDNELGIQAIHVSYADAGVRYWTRNGRFAIGIGELLWNQRTRYRNFPSLIENGASRGTGARYEIAASLPTAKNRAVDLSLALSPSIHTLLSYTFVPAFIVRLPVAELESQVDASAGYSIRTNSGHFSYGLRYINLTARFPDRSFADQNRIMMAFFKVGLRLGR